MLKAVSWINCFSWIYGISFLLKNWNPYVFLSANNTTLMSIHYTWSFFAGEVWQRQIHSVPGCETLLSWWAQCEGDRGLCGDPGQAWRKTGEVTAHSDMTGNVFNKNVCKRNLQWKLINHPNVLISCCADFSNNGRYLFGLFQFL